MQTLRRAWREVRCLQKADKRKFWQDSFCEQALYVERQGSWIGTNSTERKQNLGMILLKVRKFVEDADAFKRPAQCLLLIVFLSVNPAMAKCVALDVQHNPSKDQVKANRPYFISLRKRIESRWIAKDPWVGVTVKVRFLIAPDGTVSDIFPLGRTSDLTPEADAALRQSCLAIVESFPAGPLPGEDEDVVVFAEFKSKHPPGGGINRDKLAQALEITAIAALVGFSIYAMCKWGVAPIGSSGSSYRYGSSEHACTGSATCSVCSSCNYCRHCNAGFSPCNIWYLYH